MTLLFKDRCITDLYFIKKALYNYVKSFSIRLSPFNATQSLIVP